MTDDLVAFLNARLDEDEAAAQAAAEYPGKDWEVHPGRAANESVVFEDAGSPFAWIDSAGSAAIGEHIARYDARRALREVAAKRAVLDAYQRARTYVRGGYGVTRPVLVTLAAVYADHPDYRADWKP